MTRARPDQRPRTAARRFHLHCLHLPGMPAADVWHCPQCTGASDGGTAESKVRPLAVARATPACAAQPKPRPCDDSACPPAQRKRPFAPSPRSIAAARLLAAVARIRRASRARTATATATAAPTARRSASSSACAARTSASTRPTSRSWASRRPARPVAARCGRSRPRGVCGRLASHSKAAQWHQRRARLLAPLWCLIAPPTSSPRRRPCATWRRRRSRASRASPSASLPFARAPPELLCTRVVPSAAAACCPASGRLPVLQRRPVGPLLRLALIP